jgi:GDP/UDP-N,N'-diacetylbacillosamine 2-epimerase (hydrolysing)
MNFNIGIFTVARSDYGILKKVIHRFSKQKEYKTTLYIGSAHKSKIFGETNKEIEKKNIKKKFFKNNYISSSIKTTIDYFSETVQETDRLISKDNLDAVIIMGDRYEMLAISFVCLNHDIPIVHLCGGSTTEGSLDDCYRYAISKMAALHLVETKHHKNNLIKSNIKKNIKLVGAPALENISIDKYLKYKKIQSTKINLKEKPIISCFHPETNLSVKDNLKNLEILLKFLKSINIKSYISYPNADDGFVEYINLIHKELKNHKKIQIIKSFGIKKYYRLLNNAKLMIGNSSSGIIETASFNLPCINLGNRQKGRYSPKNVLHSRFNLKEIIKNYKIASDINFIQKLRKYKNPYFKPNTSKLIVRYTKEILKKIK